MALFILWNSLVSPLIELMLGNEMLLRSSPQSKREKHQYAVVNGSDLSPYVSFPTEAPVSILCDICQMDGEQ